jgi:hypothetical protein
MDNDEHCMCFTCLHKDESIFIRPCSNCQAHSLWEEKARTDTLKEAISVDWLVNYLKAEVDRGYKSDPLLVAYGMIILAAWRRDHAESIRQQLKEKEE